MNPPGETKIDGPKVQSALPGWTVEVFETLDSTNRYLLGNSAEVSSPALIVAENQSAGKGRGANAWMASSGSLTFSLLVDPGAIGLVDADVPLLSLITAGIVRKACLTLSVLDPAQLQLKWPNDLYLNGRKLCGILLEQTTDGTRRLIVGIGLNANNSQMDMPPEIWETAIALCDAVGEPVDRTKLSIRIVTLFQHLMEDPELRRDYFPTMWQSAHLLDGLPLVVDRGRENRKEDLVSGICEGIDESGALLLRDESRQHRSVAGGVRSWGE